MSNRTPAIQRNMRSDMESQGNGRNVEIGVTDEMINAAIGAMDHLFDYEPYHDTLADDVREWLAAALSAAPTADGTTYRRSIANALRAELDLDQATASAAGYIALQKLRDLYPLLLGPTIGDDDE